MRRLNFRRDDGVAMTEFALILPIFMAIFPQTKEQLRLAMSVAIARRPGYGADDSARKDGRLICVLGPKGGTGKTLTSTNLATALALAGQKVLVIDLDLQFGDVALCLGLPPEKTMYDLAISPGGLDDEKLRDYVMTHDTGVDVPLIVIGAMSRSGTK